MRYEFEQPIPYPELEKELRGFSRMLDREGWSRITNLVISFDGERNGEPPLPSWDLAGFNTVTIIGRLASVRRRRPSQPALAPKGDNS